MLKELLLIHPLGLASAFVCCLFNLITGYTRKFFIVPLHINFGVLFYALTLIGSLVGAGVARLALKNDILVPWVPHVIVAGFAVILLSAGALSGFLLLLKKGNRGWMLGLHRYCNAALTAVFVAAACIGVQALVTVL